MTPLILSLIRDGELNKTTMNTPLFLDKNVEQSKDVFFGKQMLRIHDDEMQTQTNIGNDSDDDDVPSFIRELEHEALSQIKRIDELVKELKTPQTENKVIQSDGYDKDSTDDGDNVGPIIIFNDCEDRHIMDDNGTTVTFYDSDIDLVAKDDRSDMYKATMPIDESGDTEHRMDTDNDFKSETATPHRPIIITEYDDKCYHDNGKDSNEDVSALNHAAKDKDIDESADKLGIDEAENA